MTAHIDFTSLPDAEAARLMAERDGWRVVQDGKRWLVYEPNSQDWRLLTTDENEVNEWLLAGLFTCYPDSLDAAVGWLGRMGLELAMLKQGKEYPWLARCQCQPINHAGPTAARAVCNAGWAAVQAREAANG